MRRGLVKVLGILLLLSPSIAGAAFFERGEGRFLVMNEEIGYRADDATASSFEIVLADPQGWVSQKEQPLRTTNDPISIWAKFGLPAVDSVKLILIDSSAWERAEYFVLRDGRVVDHQLQGTLVPLKERTIHIGMTPVFVHAGFIAVELLPQVHTTVIARLATSQKYVPVDRLRFSVWDAGQVLQGERRDRMFEGIYLCVMLVLILYNLAVFVVIREPSYFYYLIMATGGVVVWSTFFGLPSEALWPNRPWWDYYAIWLAMEVSVWGVMQFVRHYFDTGKHFPRADILLNWTSYVALLLVPLTVLPTGNVIFELGLYAFFAFITVGLTVVSGVMILALRRHHPLAPHFFAAALMSVVGEFINMAATLDLLPATDLTLHAGQIGNALTGILLSMGLGLRLRHARRGLAEKRIEDARLQSRIP